MGKLTEKDIKYLGRYMSTYSFVGQHKLEDVANEVLGLGWEAEDDVNQIQNILDALNPDGFMVEHISNCRNDDDIQVREMDNFSSTALICLHFLNAGQSQLKPLSNISILYVPLLPSAFQIVPIAQCFLVWIISLAYTFGPNFAMCFSWLFCNYI